MLKGKSGEKIDFRHNMKLYWEVVKPYKWMFISLMFIVLIIESFRLLEKYLFRAVVDSGAEFVAGSITRDALLTNLIIVGVVFVFSIIVIFVSSWLRMYLIVRQDNNIVADLKKKFYGKVLDLSHRFHTTHKTGSLISRINRGSSATETMTDIIVFNLLPVIVQVILVGVSFLYFDFLTAISVFITAIIFVVFSIYLINKAQESNLEANKADDREKAMIADALTNIEPVKYYGKETYVKRKFSSVVNLTRKKRIFYEDKYRLLTSGQGFIIGLGTFFVVLFPILSFIRGDITIGTVAFMYTAYGSLMGPLFGFVHGIRRLYKSMADLQELFKYDKEEQEVKDNPNAINLKIQKGEVEFKDVKFRYDSTDVIKRINLEIKPNQKVALVGHSGSGKTTIIKLLYRLYDVTEGSILIDGKNIKEVKQESLRSELSMVPQDVVLFDDTIYNNIAFSKPSATKEEVWQAIRFAQLGAFINSLPKKEKTIVGERGIKLSGGEKQRVAIARAILSNKRILVLDEATSALDSKTEFEIQKALKKLMEGRTSIIVAHRLSTIMHADKIVVMDKGKIINTGTHKELISKSRIYRELWSLQKGGFIEE